MDKCENTTTTQSGLSTIQLTRQIHFVDKRMHSLYEDRWTKRHGAKYETIIQKAALMGLEMSCRRQQLRK